MNRFETGSSARGTTYSFEVPPDKTPVEEATVVAEAAAGYLEGGRVSDEEYDRLLSDAERRHLAGNVPSGVDFARRERVRSDVAAEVRRRGGLAALGAA